ncbi:hypothetical protein EXIGLDRAFT_360040 [Exidia glandulosa HHB12029]|uniref:Uncharacterized protein n=1 Tax=Exidia glandulosa HHB12029 TaxID=1314781 RepID=A0A165C6Z0_EXIGL|nr:hypothetical protein EXIGLDRAFT_360040 [Exidia glandulosa HHB12029]
MARIGLCRTSRRGGGRSGRLDVLQPCSSAEGGVDSMEGGTGRSAREVCDWNDDTQREESTSAEAYGEASGAGGSGRSAPVHERNDANAGGEPHDSTLSAHRSKAGARHISNANSAKPHGRAEGAAWIISALAGGNRHVRNSLHYALLCICGVTINPKSALRSLGWPESAPGQSYTVSLQALRPTVSSIADLRISVTLDDHPTVQPFVLEHDADPLASSALNSGVAAAYATCWVWWKKYKSLMATKTHPTKAPATDRRNKLKLLATSGLEVPIGSNYSITRCFSGNVYTPQHMRARHGWTFKDIVDLDHHGEVHIRVVAAVNPPRSVDDLLLRLTPRNRARRSMDMVYGEQTNVDRTLRLLHEHWLEIMSS